MPHPLAPSYTPHICFDLILPSPPYSFRVVGLQETGHQDSNCGVRKSATVLRFLTQCLLQGITFSKPGLALKIN